MQVGGLALVVHAKHPNNIMKTVKLKSFIGDSETVSYGLRSDYWEIDCEDFLVLHKGATGRIAHPAQYLMPLGDKQTQDELRKEKEHEFN